MDLFAERIDTIFKERIDTLKQKVRQQPALAATSGSEVKFTTENLPFGVASVVKSIHAEVDRIKSTSKKRIKPLGDQVITVRSIKDIVA